MNFGINKFLGAKMIELTIKIKDDHNSFTKKELVYDSISLSHDDATLQKMVEQAQREINVKMEAPETTIKAMMVW